MLKALASCHVSIRSKRNGLLGRGTCVEGRRLGCGEVEGRTSRGEGCIATLDLDPGLWTLECFIGSGHSTHRVALFLLSTLDVRRSTYRSGRISTLDCLIAPEMDLGMKKKLAVGSPSEVACPSEVGFTGRVFSWQGCAERGFLKTSWQGGAERGVFSWE